MVYEAIQVNWSEPATTHATPFAQDSEQTLAILPGECRSHEGERRLATPHIERGAGKGAPYAIPGSLSCGQNVSQPPPPNKVSLPDTTETLDASEVDVP